MVCASRNLAYEPRSQIYGPVLQPVNSIKSLNQSSAELYQFLDGSLEAIPDNVVFTWVDVRDVATTVVAAIVCTYALSRGSDGLPATIGAARSQRTLSCRWWCAQQQGDC